MERIKAIIAEKIIEPATDRLLSQIHMVERLQYLLDVRRYRDWTPEEEKEVLILRDELYR